MDFYKIRSESTKQGHINVYPDFINKSSKDYMIRGKSFYAVWDESIGLWTTNEYAVTEMINNDISKVANELQNKTSDIIHQKLMSSYSSGMWSRYKKWIKENNDNYHPLDQKIIFANTPVEKNDYATHKLDYEMKRGNYPAYYKLMHRLYSQEERRKFEWAIGSIIAGDSKNIQKFFVFYGAPGSGKSTVMDIIQKMFPGYCTIFDAKSLASNNDNFSMDFFENDPLIAIQTDGDLSRIEDNTKLNSIVSHEKVRVNAKFKSPYEARANCMLFMGTNHPVQITDNKSGILRRLIIISPTGNTFEANEYFDLINQVEFELGAIAYHCYEVYKKYGKNYYDSYRPTDMLEKTNPFYNFMLDNYDEFKDGVSLSLAYKKYKEYCNESNFKTIMAKYKFRDEFSTYFAEYNEQHWMEDHNVKNWYSGIILSKLGIKEIKANDPPGKESSWLNFNSTESIFDTLYSAQPAQYDLDGHPECAWNNNSKKLSGIDTSKLHWVKIPDNMIILDFDITDETGNKSFELNLAEAAKYPPTYAELSKSGAGIHLHYIYDGDITKLANRIGDKVEIKKASESGNPLALRRKLTKCCNLMIATISSGLPLKGAFKKKMVSSDVIQDEIHLRNMIKTCLAKKHHGATAPEVDYIFKHLEDAYNQGLHYDVSDMRPNIMSFAANSSHQADRCLLLVSKMKWASKDISEAQESKNDEIIFYDVEVFPNVFILCYKKLGDDIVIRLINPSPEIVNNLFKYKIIGFNNRRYDNHICYAWIMGYNNRELYNLSQRIINNSPNALFSEAYNMSYTDIYDYASKKQSLKKWEIELHIHHQENSYPWDRDLDPIHWNEVADYCCNDVRATEAVWNATHGDFLAREILADIAGGTVNDTTNSLTTKIIFGENRHPELIYTDLSTGKSSDGSYKETNKFEGYEYKNNHNIYKGYDVSKGGLVLANHGMYWNAITLDIASLHPHSMKELNIFGEYTKNFTDLMDARLFIKHKDYISAAKLFGGKLKKYLTNSDDAKALSKALKIAINSVYGLTSASFDNPFRDKRNNNNIVALRGALFMYDLKQKVEEKGFIVIHIKTDSIKIANPTPEIIDFCMDEAKHYGYTFEIEHTWDRICLINDAVYIGMHGKDDPESPGEWEATGKQFQVPYVYKTCFSHEPIEFDDYCITMSTSTKLYLDFNEGEEDQHQYRFVGKVGLFTPVKEGYGAGLLLREKSEAQKKNISSSEYGFATGAKGYRWMESEVLRTFPNWESMIDKSYFDKLVADAVNVINKFGDYNNFIKGE